jgi:hypothetical protein
LAQKLRDAGFDVAIEGKTGAARMTAIPDNVSELFSTRTRVGERWARLEADHEGIEWDDLTKQEQERRVVRYTRDKDQQLAKGQKTQETLAGMRRPHSSGRVRNRRN